jgi:hypothetical protein
MHISFFDSQMLTNALCAYELYNTKFLKRLDDTIIHIR